MGVKKITINASIENGGAVLGKAGFVATKKTDVYRIYEDALKSNSLTHSESQEVKSIIDSYYKLNVPTKKSESVH